MMSETMTFAFKIEKEEREGKRATGIERVKRRCEVKEPVTQISFLRVVVGSFVEFLQPAVDWGK